jgi:hypothetical protein
MRTLTQLRIRPIATVLTMITVGVLATGCHAAGAATAHALPAKTASAASPAGTAPGVSAAPSTPGTPGTPAPEATATAGAPVPGGCLISPQEASTAFGHSAGTGAGNASTCTYQTAGGILSVFATGYGDNATTAFTSQRQAATGLPGFQDVSGVGDHAFVNLDDPMSLIEFVSGSTVVVIQLGISPAPAVTVLTTLGQAAAGRI